MESFRGLPAAGTKTNPSRAITNVIRNLPETTTTRIRRIITFAINSAINQRKKIGVIIQDIHKASWQKKQLEELDSQ